ncbi:class I SAM-dependent methyltransferase [Schaalia vaccimaxillae]|uniref:class I SAM-dependent methyltransferase n=1 Tax=Schaalia vaccimaxillae TaxID=183916 RepID=UPI00047A3FAB|nr:class I SAM-dependent methyltransferase [Schaalia vaccimaxillae]
MSNNESNEAVEATRLAAQQWETRYAASEQTWSGRANPVLVDVVTDLVAGRALDVGCGEGADAIWLASQGWSVDGLDFSATAIARAAAAAEADGMIGVRFHEGELASWGNGYEGGYDLVTAMFIQAYDGQDRAKLLSVAARMVAPGGRLLVVSHASPPPWSSHALRDDVQSLKVTPEGDRRIVDPEATWHVELCEVRAREVVGPDGVVGELEDSVLLVRRR